MSRKHVDHNTIQAFAEKKVNLSSDDAKEYRVQANRLREKIDSYINEHDQFSLRKMILSGSIAKHTALSSINDIDVACYISGADTPSDRVELITYLKKKLEKAFPNINPDQIVPNTYSVTMSFRGTGLDVDVVPIIYDGDENWYGDLVSQDDGSLLRTNIKHHLEFLQKRKRSDANFSQVIRLLKYWAKKEKASNANFRLKSFMIEMLLSHLCDNGLSCDDYIEALQGFFTYIAKTGLKEQVAFSDYYKLSEVPAYSDPIQIIDPVNKSNNVARLYTDSNRKTLVEAAIDAGDAIDAAEFAPTQEKTVYYWQKVFGSSFNIY